MASAPRRWALWAESIILCFEASTLSASSEERLIKYGACTESLTPSLLASLPPSSACLGGIRTHPYRRCVYPLSQEISRYTTPLNTLIQTEKLSHPVNADTAVDAP